jgi:hypothetical protein
MGIIQPEINADLPRYILWHLQYGKNKDKFVYPLTDSSLVPPVC